MGHDFSDSPALSSARKRGGAARLGLTAPAPLQPVLEDDLGNLQAPPATPPARADAEPRPATKPRSGGSSAKSSGTKTPTGATWAYASVLPVTATRMREMASRRGAPLANIVIHAIDAYEPPSEPRRERAPSDLPLSEPARTEPRIRERIRVQPHQLTWIEGRVKASGMKMSAFIGAALDAFVEPGADDSR